MDDIQGQQFSHSLHMLNTAGVESSFSSYLPGIPTGSTGRRTSAKVRNIAADSTQTSVPRKRSARIAAAREPLLGTHLGWTTFDFINACFCSFSAVLLAAHFHRMAHATALPTSALLYAFLFASSVALLLHWSPLPYRQQKDGAAQEYLQILKTIALAAVVARALLSLIGDETVNRLALESGIVLTFCTMALARSSWRWRQLSWRRHGNFVRNFAIAGVNDESRLVCDYLTSLSYGGYNFKGFISIDDAAPVAGIDPASVIGSIDSVMPLARSLFVDEIFLIKRPKTGVLKKAIEEARSADIDLRLIPDISETLNRRTDVHYIGDMPTIVLHRACTQEVSQFFKRLLDVLVASLALILLMPLFLLIAIAIKWDSPGSVFYGSDRVGLKGRVFRCCKFRTMVSNAHDLRAELKHLNERDGILFKIAKDPRITRMGRLFRKYSLDELPQLWNVVRGDMSLVGPRPPIGDEVAQYRIDQFCRLEVPPGITGLWQIEARSNPSFESYIELDRKYVNNWSFWLDLRILFRTAAVVVRGTGS